MNEHEIINKISSLKHLVISEDILLKNLLIPEAVFIWSFWKRFYLEDLQQRNLFSQHFDLESFSQLIKQTTRPSRYFPNFVRRDKRKIRDWLKELFIYWKYTLNPDLPFRIKEAVSFQGLCLTSESSKDASNELIWGILYYVSDDTRDALIYFNYPSLFQKENDCAIVAGPLALINHSCSSPFAFSKPSNKYPNEELECFFGGHQRIFLKHVDSDDNHAIEKGEEITVRYAPRKDLHFKCKCDLCSMESMES